MVIHRRPILRWTAIVLAGLVIAVGGSVLGLRLSSPVLTETAAGRVSIDVTPSTSGEVEAFIPLADWGVRSDVFTAPIKVRAELESVNRAALLRLAEGNTDLLSATEQQLKDGARKAVILAVRLGGGDRAPAAGPGDRDLAGLTPRWSLLAIGILITVVAYGAMGLRARSDLESGALNNTTYFAQGEEITRILDLAEDPRFESGYGSEFSSIVRSIGAVLGEAGLDVPEATEIFSGSDLHANALVIDPLARMVGDDPLLLAGDFGQRGGQAEAALLAPKVAAIGSGVVADLRQPRQPRADAAAGPAGGDRTRAGGSPRRRREVRAAARDHRGRAQGSRLP